MKTTVKNTRRVFASMDTSTELNAEVSRIAKKLTRNQYKSNGHLLDLDPVYYVYALLDPTKPGSYEYVVKGKLIRFSHEPFYIGKGHGNRIKDHVAAARQKANPKSHKENRIRKILRSGAYPIEKIMSRDIIEAVALAKEAILIKGIGRRTTRKGPLTNISPGGDGIAGIPKSAETRRKLSRPCGEETKQKLREANLGKTHTKETRRKLSEKSKAFVRTDAHKAAISAALTGRTLSNAHRQALVEAWKHRSPPSEETLRRLHESNIGRKHSEESKRKRSEALKGRKQPRLICPHCRLEGAENAMKRWHFDNCRSR